MAKSVVFFASELGVDDKQNPKMKEPPVGTRSDGSFIVYEREIGQKQALRIRLL